MRTGAHDAVSRVLLLLGHRATAVRDCATARAHKPHGAPRTRAPDHTPLVWPCRDGTFPWTVAPPSRTSPPSHRSGALAPWTPPPADRPPRLHPGPPPLERRALRPQFSPRAGVVRAVSG